MYISLYTPTSTVTCINTHVHMYSCTHISNSDILLLFGLCSSFLAHVGIG